MCRQCDVDILRHWLACGEVHDLDAVEILMKHVGESGYHEFMIIDERQTNGSAHGRSPIPFRSTMSAL
jgi:hypothetical protein